MQSYSAPVFCALPQLTIDQPIGDSSCNSVNVNSITYFAAKILVTTNSVSRTNWLTKWLELQTHLCKIITTNITSKKNIGKSTQILHRAKWYFTCISNTWYLITVSNMNKINPCFKFGTKLNAILHAWAMHAVWQLYKIWTKSLICEISHQFLFSVPYKLAQLTVVQQIWDSSCSRVHANSITYFAATMLVTTNSATLKDRWVFCLLKCLQEKSLAMTDGIPFFKKTRHHS